MIQIAIISDIHGNIRALEAVMNDIKERKIEQIFCLGDLVDFAPWGNEVIDRLRNKGIPCILGNHDERIAFDLPILPISHHSDTEKEARIIAINHSKRTITEDNKQWLRNLPYNLELTYKVEKRKVKILLVHANLRSNYEYLFIDDISEDMTEELKKRSIDILAMGHTHISYIKEMDFSTIINVGSVGRSREKDRKATYAIITIRNKNVENEIIKVDYNIKDVYEKIKESSIPSFYADFLLNEKSNSDSV